MLNKCESCHLFLAVISEVQGRAGVPFSPCQMTPDIPWEEGNPFVIQLAKGLPWEQPGPGNPVAVTHVSMSFADAGTSAWRRF